MRSPAIFDPAELDAELARALAHRRRGQRLFGRGLAAGLSPRRSPLARRPLFARRRAGRSSAGAPIARVSRRSAGATASLCGPAARAPSGSALPSARGSSLRGAAPAAWPRLAAGALGLEHHQHRADGIMSPSSPASSSDLAGDRAIHLDRRLVGHHVDELLVLVDRVADLDVPGDDLGLGDAFADVGQLEDVASHPQPSNAFLSAAPSRFGPGK